MSAPIVLANPDASRVGRLAQTLVEGYYAHAAAITVATHPQAAALAPPTLPGHSVPVGFVDRKDGTQHAFHFTLYLERAATNPLISAELPRVWLTGSLITLGDASTRHSYFDRAPELELLRHLRHGVAHGNRFKIDNPAGLLKFPAHNRLAAITGDHKEIFEITPSLQGQPVLFDFMGPANVLDLLMSVSLYLVRMGNGEPLRP